MTRAGIRELKNNLSRFVERARTGERIAVTMHGRAVAELGPAGGGADRASSSRFDRLVAAGAIRPPAESGDPLEDWPDIRLPTGSVAALIEADRDED
ncbi:MAG: type II toxin-antitoxin system Phd/YefM family antitoxin [Bacteroidales bacterium]